MSICAIEHFDDGPLALSEMARVLAPGGELVMSADTLSRAADWPHLYQAHCERYHVQRTYTHSSSPACSRSVGWTSPTTPTSSVRAGRSGFT